MLLGIIIALPVSYIVLNVCKYLEVTLLTTSIIQTTVFTLLQSCKYIVRITFKKGELDGTPKPKMETINDQNVKSGFIEALGMSDAISYR